MGGMIPIFRVLTLTAGKELGKVKPSLICAASISNTPVFPVFTCGFPKNINLIFLIFDIPHNLNCILNTSKPQKNKQQELGVECWLGKKKKCIYTLHYGILGIKSSSLPPQAKDGYGQTLPFYPLCHSQSIVLQGLSMLQIILLLLHKNFFE